VLVKGPAAHEEMITSGMNGNEGIDGEATR